MREFLMVIEESFCVRFYLPLLKLFSEMSPARKKKKKKHSVKSKVIFKNKCKATSLVFAESIFLSLAHTTALNLTLSTNLFTRWKWTANLFAFSVASQKWSAKEATRVKFPVDLCHLWIQSWSRFLFCHLLLFYLLIGSRKTVTDNS